MSQPEKLSHDRKICCMKKSVAATQYIGVATCKTSPTQKSRSQHQKMKLQKGNRLSGDRTLSRQTFWVATKMTIIQDMLKQEPEQKCCHDKKIWVATPTCRSCTKTVLRHTCLRNEKNIVATKETLSR